jgi:hypothetical protein
VVRDEKLGAAARIRIAVNALELVHYFNDFPLIQAVGECCVRRKRVDCESFSKAKTKVTH